MSQSRRRYTPEYKDEAVKLVIDSGRPVSAIAKDLGINEGAWVFEVDRGEVWGSRPAWWLCVMLVWCGLGVGRWRVVA